MEITIIHGQAHKGSTYHITSIIKEKLTDSSTVVHEYFMPGDTPAYCTGCFQCIKKGEEYCPHRDKVQNIMDSILRSEIIIIDSPTYCYEMTGQLKTLFDHYGYLWMPHRPRGEMFSKTAIVVSTAAGAGAGRVTKSLEKQMFWWGIPKIYRMGFNVKASSWDGVSEKYRQKIERRALAVSRKVKSSIGKEKSNLKLKLSFHLIRKMQKSNNWSPIDREYWQKNQWLENVRPWKQ